jgi:hypothetical protein
MYEFSTEAAMGRKVMDLNSTITAKSEPMTIIAWTDQGSAGQWPVYSSTK